MSDLKNKELHLLYKLDLNSNPKCDCLSCISFLKYSFNIN